MNKGQIILLNGGSSKRFVIAPGELLERSMFARYQALEIDTTHETPASAASTVKEARDGGLRPAAFRKLSSLLFTGVKEPV